MNEISLVDLKFHHPFTMIVSGMTQSGKTEFTKKFIKNWKYLINIQRTTLKVLWCYKQSYPNCNFHNVELILFKNLPNINDMKKFKPDIIILDDLMNNINQDISDLFTIESHALGISVVFIVQNLFNKKNFMRTISLNTHYFVLMKGIRNENQVELLARQTFRYKSKEILNIFRKVTREPFSYLVFDFHPKSNSQLAIRTKIFPEEVSEKYSNLNSITPIIFEI